MPEDPASSSFSEQSTLDQASQSSASSFGHYRLLRALGEGGMGEVWLAEQTEPVRRQVALKVIKPGMDSAHVIARFEAERQALALMQHPGIAAVFEGGTTPQGRPYFAMEYVRGEPITAYSDRHLLGTRERLRLFIQVCEGVQHAHQKGVIHRDLKPSNVLVTVQDDRPVPKIIDFGVAKATAHHLTERSLFTELGVLIGTPEYMSPEQAEMGGLDVDTRTDIYALGVLLYELLTGTLPFERSELRQAGLAEIQRIIREKEPPRPSARISGAVPASSLAAERRRTEPRRLFSELRGDLDWITMRALEKDRTRRYQTASALAADVRCHLNSEPVSAGPPSAAYRARKFVRRHRLAVAAAGAFVALLIGFSVALAIQAVRLEAARREADRRFNEVRALAHSVVFEMHDAIEDLPGSTSARQLLVRRSLEYLDRLAQEAGADPSLQLELATAYTKIGDVQGRPFQPNLGDSEGALSSYRKAREILETLTAARPADRAVQRQLGLVLTREATLLDDWRADTQGALALVARALALQRELVAAKPDVLDYHRSLSYALVKTGDLQERAGLTSEALATFSEYLRICEDVAARTATSEDPKRLDDLRSVRVAHFRLAGTTSLLGDHARALRHARLAHESALQAADVDPPSARALRDRASTAILVGDVLSRSGSPREAVPFYEDALAQYRVAVERDPQDATAGFDVTVAGGRLADAYAEVGDAQGALVHYLELLPLLRRLIERDPHNAEYQATTAAAEASIGELRLRSGDAAGAFAAYLRALAWFEPALSDTAGSRLDLAVVLLGAGRAQLALAGHARSSPGERRRHRSEACARLARSLELLRGLSGPTLLSHFEFRSPETLAAEAEELLGDCRTRGETLGAGARPQEDQLEVGAGREKRPGE